MSRTLKLFELPASPNNVKARIALGFKGLSFERSILQFNELPGDRSAIVEVSGQPRTPVLQHGETAIFDSGAIMRYLEANFPDTPRLFSTDYAEMGEIERWEWFGRGECSAPVGLIFGQAMAPDKDATVIRHAQETMRELTNRIEDQLAATGFLVGGRATAADVTAVPLVALTMLSASETAGPVVQFFAENFTLGDGRDRTRAWVEKVQAHDPHRG